MRILHTGNEDVLGFGMLRIQCQRRQKEGERSYMLLVRTENQELAAAGRSGNTAGLTYKGQHCWRSFLQIVSSLTLMPEIPAQGRQRQEV